MHHSIPTEILKKLPPKIANDPRVRGQRGDSNKISVEREKHQVAHQDGYNQRFKDAIKRAGGYTQVTIQQLRQARDRLVKRFGL